MENDPIRVPLVRVVEFLRDIGLDPVDVDDLRSVHFDPGVLTVTRYRRDELGRLVCSDNEVLTETTTIRVEGGTAEPNVVDVTEIGDAEPRHMVG